jgi:hypothetical protein
VIRYKIPNDKNLLGVKAVYTRNGEVCESKASKYTDSLVVEGFGSAASQEVQLYSVGVNEKLSEPISVQISPLTPPVRTVTFDIEEGFGGVVISLDKNYSNASLAVVLLSDTLSKSGEQRQWMQLQSFHTGSTARTFSRRGLEAKTVDFAVYVRDRWGNMSDTIFRTLTPLDEIKLPKNTFRNAALPTDYFEPAEELPDRYGLQNLWDGDERIDGVIYATTHQAPMPSWVTISLGYKASISRIQKWPRAGFELYSSSAPRTFELWGSDNPNPDGSWDDSWHLLGEFEQFKPSGYGEGREVGPITDEDRDYWNYRTEFELTPTENTPNPYMPVTHVRFKFTSTFATYGTDSPIGQVIIGEITFWGQLRD